MGNVEFASSALKDFCQADEGFPRDVEWMRSSVEESAPGDTAPATYGAPPEPIPVISETIAPQQPEARGEA